ncbi:MAG: aminotransferase class III-fold pyridoxal phosphate-dependent enzyme [Phycisphaeraceae bacterium]
MFDTAADKLRNDPRLQKARDLIARAMADAQRHIDGPRPADPQRSERYQQLLDAFAKRRGGALPIPYLGSGLGRGPFVELMDGSVKYDMICGIGVHGLGHSDAGLTSAGIDGALADAIMQGNLQQNAESADLCDELVERACRGGATLSHCFLTTSGSMANDNALKIILQKHAPADRMLAFSQCFTGRTLAMASLTDKAAYRDGLPETMKVGYLPFYKPDDREKSIASTIKHLDNHVARYQGRVAGVMFEMIQGEGGYNAGDASFFHAVMSRCKEHGLAVWVDEIQSFGRTSQPFAFQHYGLDSLVDVVSVGKMTQVCATLFTPAYNPRPGLISQTFTGASSQIFAAREVLRRLDEGGVFGDDGLNMTYRKRFADELTAIHLRHPDKLSARHFGEGTMIGFEVFGGEAEKTKAVMNRLYDLGVIAFLCGSSPLRLRFLPPVSVMQEADVQAVCQLLEQAIIDVAAD